MKAAIAYEGTVASTDKFRQLCCIGLTENPFKKCEWLIALGDIFTGIHTGHFAKQQQFSAESLISIHGSLAYSLYSGLCFYTTQRGEIYLLVSAKDRCLDGSWQIVLYSSKDSERWNQITKLKLPQNHTTYHVLFPRRVSMFEEYLTLTVADTSSSSIWLGKFNANSKASIIDWAQVVENNERHQIRAAIYRHSRSIVLDDMIRLFVANLQNNAIDSMQFPLTKFKTAINDSLQSNAVKTFTIGTILRLAPALMHQPQGFEIISCEDCMILAGTDIMRQFFIVNVENSETLSSATVHKGQIEKSGTKSASKTTAESNMSAQQFIADNPFTDVAIQLFWQSESKQRIYWSFLASTESVVSLSFW